jgi:hypothetical protein
MRSVVAAALAAFASLVALPACEPGTEGSTPDAATTTPGDGGKGCPLPAPESCSQDECNTRGNCSIFSCDERDGTWSQTVCEPPPPPPPEIDGRWILFRWIQDDPCPEITRVDPFELQARPAIGGGEAISSLDGTKLSLGAVQFFGFETVITFGFDELWSAGDVSLPVRVDYELHFDDSNTIQGQASASVPLGERTCAYTFRVNGGVS